MTSTNRPRATKATLAALADVISHLEALADTRPNDDAERVATYQRIWNNAPTDDLGVSAPGTIPIHACAVDREHREAARLYVESWILEPLRAVTRQLDGTATWTDEAYLDGYQ